MSLLRSYPNASRLFLFIILTLLALILPDYIYPSREFKNIFPFVGLILLVAVNWFLYKLEGKSLNQLGFNYDRYNLQFLPFGLFLGVAAVLLGYLLKCQLTGDKIIFNRDFQTVEILKHLYWILPTAAAQEFICRSYGYKKLISTTNLRIANVITLCIFIAMHDIFNIGIFGAIFYSISIIIGHFVFANALLSSGTIFFSIGIHWGSNLANNRLFTDQKISTSILYLEKVLQEEAGGPNPLGILLYIIALNLGFIILWIILRKWRKGKETESQ